MSETKHTATPWIYKADLRSYRGGTEEITGFNIIGEGNEVVGCEGINAANEADAAFIVRAVNSHDALVEALAELVDRMRGVIAREYMPDSFTLQRAEAALKRAEGEA